MADYMKRRKSDDPSQEEIDKKLWVARPDTCEKALEAVERYESASDRRKCRKRISLVKDFRVPCDR